MQQPTQPTAGTGRRRGRPSAEQATGDTRELLVSAARRRFASDGFDRASLRSIAADAGVDASLIRHYFGDKNGLLVATMQLPVDPSAMLRELIAEGPDGLGHRLVTGFLQTWDKHHDVFSALLRTTIASADAAPPTLELLRAIVLRSLTGVLDGPDAPLRANLVMSQVIGMAMLRYLLRIEPLVSSSVEEVAARYGPVLQALITPEPAG